MNYLNFSIVASSLNSREWIDDSRQIQTIVETAKVFILFW